MVLVAAVTALALMSVLALGLAETTVLDERLAEKSLAALQADALARSGVAVATVVLAETGAAGAPDTLRAPWAVDVGRQPLGPGWVEVQVEDEARRLDLNAPELTDAVPRLLAARGRGPLAAEDIAALLPDAPSAVRLALTPRGQHYSVRAVGGVGAVRRSVEATLAAPGGVEPEIVAWRAVEG